MDKVAISDESLIADGFCDYGSRSYWNHYYKESNRDEAIEEWYLRYNQIKPLFGNEVKSKTIPENIDHKFRFLHLGCGKSMIGLNIYRDFDCQVDNIDFSEIAIQYMTDNVNEDNGCRWHCMSCTKIKFDDETFDFAIDKAVFDSVECGSTPIDDIAGYCKEVQRVLKKGGKWIIISHAPPERRLEYLFNDDELFGPILSFDVRVQILDRQIEAVDSIEDNCTEYYAYICEKM